ncbi:MAG: TonB-dependent receptor [Agriterribacter sp.]
MKLTTVLLLAAMLQAAAKSDAQTVTYAAESVSLEKVFVIIKQQTGYVFFYREEDITGLPTVSVAFKNTPLATALQETLKGQPLQYNIQGKTIFITSAGAYRKKNTTQEETISEALSREITGVVRDKKGAPLEGVSVTVKGTQMGTTTNAEGRFQLSVPSANNVELLFSFVGYATQTVKAGSRTMFDIVLEEAVADLSDVVVVGYGTQKKANLTGAVSSVKGDEINRAGAANISETMAGKISGISIEPVSGEPGVNPTIHIRGIGTTGSSAPLVVIDGIIRDNLSDIDPAVIESVSVLKDAAAVAPYGLGGANGVLLITTKSGRVDKFVLSLDAYKGNQKPAWLPNPLNVIDYMKLQNEAATNINGTAPYATDFIDNYTANHNADPDKYPDAKSRDLLNKLVPVQNYNIKASGGSGNTNYFLGGGYFGQDGLFDQINYHRYNFNANLNSKVTKTTRITVNIINSYDQKNELSPTYTSSSMLRWLYFIKPTDAMIFSNGKWGTSNNISLIGGLKSGSYNRADKKSLMNTFTIDQQLPFVKGLSVKGAFSYDLTNNFIKGFSKPAYYWNQDLTTTPYTYTQQVSNMEQTSSPNPALYETYSEKQAFTYQGYLNYHNVIKDHDITFLGVAELRKSNYKILNTSMKNFPLAIDEFDLGSSNTSDYSISGSSSESIQVGYVYKAGYVYKSKYMVEAAGRYDGHYYFAPGKRFAFFPSFSLGWRLSEEAFMKSFTFVDNLKIRGSWGKSGNLAGSAYQYLTGYNFYANQYAFGGNVVSGAYPSNEPNPNITWEISNKSDVGIEASLWKNLLSLEVDYFFERRTGMLLPPATTVPFEYGINLSDENAGIMNNHGVELAIGSKYQFKNLLRLGLNGNFSYAKNKMIKVFETAATYDNPNRRRTNRPVNTPFGYHSLGLFSADDDKNGDGIINALDGYSITQFSELHPGDVKYEDVNKDGKIDANDQMVIGYSTYPQITYGFTPSIEWKGFDLALFFQGVVRNSMNINNRFQTVSLLNTQSNTDYEYVNNHWTPDHQDARYPRAYIGPNPNNNSPESDFWYKRGDYFRLKNAVIGYTVPGKNLKPLNISSLRLYFSGTNIFTITKVNFFDPEAIYGGSGAGTYPSMKQFVFGVSVIF